MRPVTISTALRMGGLDDLAGRGIEAAPEAQWLIEHEGGAGTASLDESRRLHQLIHP